MISCIVISQNIITTDRLRKLISQNSNWVLLAVVGSTQEASNTIRKFQPDICILDFEVDFSVYLLKEFQHTSNSGWLVCSSERENALALFELKIELNLDLIEFLLVPIETISFQKVANRIEHKLYPMTAPPIISTKHSENDLKLGVKESGEVKLVNCSEIIWVSSASNYVEIHTVNKTLIHRSSISNMKKFLNSHFLRVHRTAIVNVKYISKVFSPEGRFNKIKMNNGDIIKIGNLYKNDVLKKLGVI